MKKDIHIIVVTIICIYALSFLFFAFVEDQPHNIFGDFDWKIIGIPTFFLVIPILILGFFITLCRGKYEFYNYFKTTKWTGLISLMLIVGSALIIYTRRWYLNKYEGNIIHNKFYKSFYGDARDNLVNLSIHAIEEKQKSLNDYGIYELGVTERDTFLNSLSLKYYVVNQIYFMGKKFSKDNAHVSRHLVFSDKTVLEIYDKPLVNDSIGLAEWQRHIDFIDKFKNSKK